MPETIYIVILIYAIYYHQPIVLPERSSVWADWVSDDTRFNRDTLR